MIDPVNVLQRMGVDVSNRALAIRSYRDRFEEALTTDVARQHVEQLTGVDYKFDDLPHAKYTVLYVIEAILNTQEGERNFNQLVLDSFARANTFLNRKDMAFLFATKDNAPVEAAQVQVGEETVTVAKKSDGSIKKGGKKVIAINLYKEHVVKNGMDSKDFIKLLMKEADMNEGGARTYYHICKKECV